MLVWSYGKTMGSIGGGCAEGEVISKQDPQFHQGNREQEDHAAQIETDCDNVYPGMPSTGGCY